MADGEYKISLGVDLKTDDIKNQINGIEAKVDPIKINIDLNHTKKQIDAIKKQIQSLNNIKVNLGTGTVSNSGNVGAKNVNKTVNELTTAYNKLKNISKNIGSIKIKLSGGLNTSKDIQQIKVLENQLKSLTTQYHNTVSKIKGKGDLSSAQWQTIQHQIDNTGIKLEQLGAKLSDTKAELASGIRGNFNGYSAQVESLVEKFGKLSGETGEVQIGIKNVKQALSDMKAASNDNDLIAAEERYQIALKETESQLRKNIAVERQSNNADNLSLAKENALLRLKNLFGDNSEAAKKFGLDVQRLQKELNECGNMNGIHKVNKQISNLSQRINEANVQTQTFSQKLKQQWEHYKSYLSVATIFMYTTMAMKDMFEQVKAIDSAMTELKKVTDETDATYNKFLTNAATRSREIGTTIDGLVKSTADFARLGYGFKDAQGLAEVANIYAVVGDEIEGVEGATESLISTMAAFRAEANGLSESDFALSIVDKFNEVSNNFAISSGGLGEALKRSASAMYSANNTLDETIALITASNTVVQDADVVGNAYKTIALRIRGAKSELEEMGEDTSGMVESSAKLREELLALSGVDILEADGKTFKSTYDILDEISKVYKDLSDISQANILEKLAGKRQANILSAALENFDIARDALETSLNSAGSAMAEHEKWQQSLEAQINKLKASWQGLSQAFMSSDFLKVAFDFVIKLVDGITLLIDKVGVLPTLFTGFAIFKSFGNKGLFKTFNNDLDGFTNKVGIANKSFSELMNAFKTANTGGFKGFFNGLKSMGDALANPLSQADLSAIDTYNKLIDDGIDGQTAFAQTMQGTSNAAQGLVKSAKGGKVALDGMKTASIGAKVGLIGAKAAAIAFNAAVTMGISLLIDWAVSGIMKWINASDDLAEKVDEITSKYKEQHASLMDVKNDYDTSNESSMINKYAKLSKGVDSLGRNVSLTADEYSEYQGIVNNIAEQIPSLISGYDAQGNAILGCKDNVEALVTAYEDLIAAQNREILNKAGEIEDDFANEIKNRSKDKRGLFDAFDKDLTFEDIEVLETAIKDGQVTFEELKKLINSEGVGFYRIKSALKDAGFEYSEDDIYKPQDIQKIIDGFYDAFDKEVDGQKSIAQAILSDAFDIRSSDYYNMDDNLKQVANQIVNSFNGEFLAEIQENGVSVKDWVSDMLKSLNSIDNEASDSLDAAFDLQTKFNGGEISYGEYVKGLQNAGELISKLGLDEEVENQLKLSLNIDEAKEEYDALVRRIGEIYAKDFKNTGHFSGIADAAKMAIEDAKELLDGLTANEYAVAVDLLVNGDFDFSEIKNIDDLRKYLEEEAKFNEAMSYTIAMDVETEGVEALNTAMAESVSGAGLSSEAIAALKGRYAELESEGYNLSAMFEETANGIHLNREAVGEFEQALASKKLAETDENLKVLKNRYDELTVEINNCTDAGERASLYRDQQSVIDKINDLATLAHQYKGLTSAYNAWQRAESAGSERDMYESIIDGFENVKDEISRGWIDDGTVEFLELLTGKTDLAGKSGKELKKIYNDLDDTIKNTTYSVRDFFTVDKDGNSTNTGVYNFLDAVGQLEEEAFGGLDVVKRDGKGNIIGFDFELVAQKDENGNVIKNGDQVIAEALGISEELVQIMVRAADDAGFVVNLEGTYTQLADLKTEAEAARDTLISLQKNGLEKLKDVDVNFNFDAEGNDLVAEQEKAVKLLDKFKKDGKIDLTMEGAQQALDIAEYLTIKLDDLTEPKFMQIDTSEVEEDLRAPIEKIQEIGQLCKEKHLITLTGDTEELKEVQGEIDAVAKEIEELDPEVKAQIGIDENWDAKTIADKIETGEIEIPAELELDVQMSDDLKDMRLMMMNQLGLVSDEEVKLKVGFDIDESVVDGLTDEQKEVVVKYLAEHEEVDEYTPEQKEALVEYIADGGNLDDYTPEEKQGIVKYLADGGNIEDYTPEEKQAIVEYLTDSGDPDSWTPEQKEAVAKFKKDSAEVDNYSPEDKQAIAKFIKNSIEPDTYQPPDKTQEVVANLDSSEPDNYQPTDKKFTVKAVLQKIGDWTNKLLSGGSTRKVVNGTANADGTAFIEGTTGRAFKHGDWGTKDSGTALVGELGTETLVRNGRYYTIGDTGAEFIRYEKGDIIFNHKQTEELFRYGKVTSGGGRGKAFAEGTAFSGGTGGGIGVTTTTTTKTKETTTTTTASTGSSGSGGVGKVNGKSNSSSSKSKSKSSSSSSSKSAKDDFEETIDWIEIAIERIEREIDKLDQKASNIYKSWSSRNTALKSEINKVGDEITLQQKAYNEYIKEANAVGLSSSYAKKVREGKIDIETIKDESLAEKIKSYEDYYNKALDCKDAIEELKEQEAELYAQRVENVSTKYDGILGVIEHEKNMLEEYISQSEANSQLVSAKYYNALVSNEKKNLKQLNKEKSDMLSELQAAMKSGTITKGSESWYEMVSSIDEVTLSIAESETTLKEYQQTIQQLSWESFDLLQEKISFITEETDFLIELMSNDKLHNDNGQLTNSGMATMGQHGVAYNVNMSQADKYAKEAERLRKQLQKDPYDTELEERYREMISLQREHILAAEDEKNAIRDLVEEGIELELDALQERIDKYNESVESAKDLYNYQKNIKGQTKEIASLEKQMSAYKGDDSEEAKLKVQELKVSLEEARADLQETEYERYISNQQQLLDELYLEYEEILNTRIDNIDALLSDMVAEINSNASTISTTLSTEAENVGYTLSSSMNNIWSGANNVITTYGDRFASEQTTTNNVLNTINTNIQNMISQLNTIAKTDVKSASTSSSSTSKQANASKPATPTSNSYNKTTNISNSSAKSYPYGKASETTGNIKYGARGNAVKAIQYALNQLGYGNSGTKSVDGIFGSGTRSAVKAFQKAMGISADGIVGKNTRAKFKAKGYKSGIAKIKNDEIAWTQENGQEFIVRPSDGAILTPIAKGDSVLTSAASDNIWDMANSPAEFIKDNLKFNNANVPSGSNIQNSCIQNFENINFNMPNVRSYNELISEMQRDPKFEKLILAMTVDQLAGKSSLAKNKAIR